ncbi:MAG TPA: hypothetical protein VGL28_05885, partial [Steroidobacteraceae bacterium]
MLAAAIRGEPAVTDRVPYTVQICEHLVRTATGDYVQVFRLAGAGFECADDEQLNNWHERLNILWRNVASPDLALWTHIIRRRETLPSHAAATHDFADELDHRYRTRLDNETLMINELYLSTVYRPAGGAVHASAVRLLRAARDESERQVDQAIEHCAKLAQTLQASLVRYEPQRLGTYCRNGIWHSAVLEFLGVLVNAEVQPLALPTGPL